MGRRGSEGSEVNDYREERDRLKSELSACTLERRRLVEDNERLRKLADDDGNFREYQRVCALLETQTDLNVDLQVANEELMRERDQAIRDRIKVAEERNFAQEARKLDDEHYRQAIRKLRAELECGGPHSAAEIHRMEEVHQNETDNYQADIEKWKGRYVFVKSEYDRLILERRVESGTA